MCVRIQRDYIYKTGLMPIQTLTHEPVTTTNVLNFMYVLFSIMYDTKLYVPMSCIDQGTFHK